MPRYAKSLLAVSLGLSAVVACTNSIQYPGQLVGSFNTALLPASNSCTQFMDLPGFCPENGSPGPCTDGGYPDGGTTVLVVSSGADDAGYISYQSGSQSATANGTWDGQTVQTLAVAERFFILVNQPSQDAGCIAHVTETIQLTLYATLDGGCDGGIPVGPPPTEIGGVWQTQTSPACGILIDEVQPDQVNCCSNPNPDGGGTCLSPVPPNCTVSFGLEGQGRSSPP
jgi:hypothetical protein